MMNSIFCIMKFFGVVPTNLWLCNCHAFTRIRFRHMLSGAISAPRFQVGEYRSGTLHREISGNVAEGTQSHAGNSGIRPICLRSIGYPVGTGSSGALVASREILNMDHAFEGCPRGSRASQPARRRSCSPSCPCTGVARSVTRAGDSVPSSTCIFVSVEPG
jgi:hypothetical protein